MAYPVITLTGRYTLTFKIKRDHLNKIQDMLNKNGFSHSTWQQTGFPTFYEFRVDCNIKQAEIIRRLLHHFKLYE